MTKNSKKKESLIERVKKSTKTSKIMFTCGVIALLISTCTSAVAVTYLYSANEIAYSNTSSGLSATNVQQALDQVYASANDYSKLRKMIYPVGSIYISVTDDTVAKVQDRFGGTWVAFGSGRTLVGVNTSDGDFNTVGKEAGSKAQDYTPAGTNSDMAVTMNAVSLSHSGGAVQDTTLTAAQSGQKNLGTLTSSGNNRGHTHVYSRSNDNTNATTITADQSGLRTHNHGVSKNFNFTVGNLNGSGSSGIPNGNSGWGDKGKAHWTSISINNAGPWNAAAGHSHGVGRSNQNTGGESQNHTHTLTISGSNATSAHNHGFTQPSAHSFTPSVKSYTQPTFSGTKASISHLQPYITVYMYKRTA